MSFWDELENEEDADWEDDGWDDSLDIAMEEPEEDFGFNSDEEEEIEDSSYISAPTYQGGNSFTDDIVRKESGGNYKATNPNSSAAGKYQFLWDTWGKEIKNVTGVSSKQEFLNNPQAQDAFYNDYYVPNKMLPAVDRIKRKTGTNMSNEQLAKLYHFRGEQGALDYLSGKLKDKPEEYNSSISDYIKQYGGSTYVNKEQKIPFIEPSKSTTIQKDLLKATTPGWEINNFEDYKYLTPTHQEEIKNKISAKNTMYDLAGHPNIGFLGEESESLVSKLEKPFMGKGRANYDLLTNTINVKPNSGFFPEIAHTVDGNVNYSGAGIFSDIIRPFSDIYNDGYSYEYGTHKIVEPELRKTYKWISEGGAKANNEALRPYAKKQFGGGQSYNPQYYNEKGELKRNQGSLLGEDLQFQNYTNYEPPVSIPNNDENNQLYDFGFVEKIPDIYNNVSSWMKNKGSRVAQGVSGFLDTTNDYLSDIETTKKYRKMSEYMNQSRYFPINQTVNNVPIFT
jgi:hypothetical protein